MTTKGINMLRFQILVLCSVLSNEYSSEYLISVHKDRCEPTPNLGSQQSALIYYHWFPTFPPNS